MLRRFSVNFALFSMMLDGMTVGFSLLFSTQLRPILNAFNFIEPLQEVPVVPAPILAIFPALWVMVFLAFSLYDGRKYLRAVDEFSTLTLAVLISSVSAAGILYLSFRDISRAQFVLFVILVYLLCFGWRILARGYFRLQASVPKKVRRVLVVGCGTLGEKVRVQLEDSEILNFRFVGFVDEIAPISEKGKLLGGTHDVKSVVLTEEISDVVVALPHSAYHLMAEIVKDLEDLPIQVWVALGFFDLTLYNTAIEDFAGIPMLDLRASAIDDYQRLVKRAFDLVMGLVALLLFSPLMAISALLVYLGDGPPVLFRQKRAGENGRPFEMLKFRTMVRNAGELQSLLEKRGEGANVPHKTKSDPRVTRVGQLLRRFSLDELPQFIN
ncbi:MAG: hypothetical protein FJZ87_13385, partial [Chloroflexi bacterium]|nr:hypothetical protein [Chloroflexota bacterium]